MNIFFCMRLRYAAFLTCLLAACAVSGRPARTPHRSTTVTPHATVLLSLDGFRADYLDRPGAIRLRALAAQGVRAERLVPAFPSKTFPNHYTLVTGLHPDHHGIVANTMSDAVIGARFSISDTLIARDPRWWGGEPIWNTAERQGVRTAAFYWPGSDYAVNGRYPTYYRPYDGRIPNQTRVRQVLDWLAMPADSVPRLVTFYFSTADDAGHAFGPSSPQVDAAIAHVDSLVGDLVDGLAARGLTEQVNVIIVSDHGMTEISPERVIFLDDYIDLREVEVVDWMPVAAIVPRAGSRSAVSDALRRAPHLQVWTKERVPARYHYRSHPRITPLVLLADEGWTITSHQRFAITRPTGGTHGYDNFLPSMGALFVAAGPDIARGRILPPVANIHVYALLAELLGVTPAANDGSLDSLRGALRR